MDTRGGRQLSKATTEPETVHHSTKSERIHCRNTVVGEERGRKSATIERGEVKKKRETNPGAIMDKREPPAREELARRR